MVSRVDSDGRGGWAEVLRCHLHAWRSGRNNARQQRRPQVAGSAALPHL